MPIRVVTVNVDQEKLKNTDPDTSFETEMGWVADSGIMMESNIEIPDELAGGDPIETAWIMNEVREQIKALYDSDTNLPDDVAAKIKNISDKDFNEIVKAIQGNYESIEQDINWRICDILGIKDE